MLFKKLIKFFFKISLMIILGLIVVSSIDPKMIEGKTKRYIDEKDQAAVEMDGNEVNDRLADTKQHELLYQKSIFTYQPLPQNIIDKIKGISWKKGAPATLESLAYVKVSYFGFDDKIHQGELIVHKEIAQEVTGIFKELYAAKFPIEKIKLIDEYGANDDLSMADNNTSSFCFREVEGSDGKLSKHSFGIAIDINPVQNPYIRKKKISPSEGEPYRDRLDIKKGMIVKDDVCYKAFKSRGWIWGGEWKTMKDYQHFQKNIVLK
ncbi:M15 family metallopeptidase [Marinisporobacter balticus]|uniref:D-alanyl-D-alanine carboxypeptidase-like protein n=1 Tax=Marinisporobacter balticus TaxID=2018667 RepID=A0A4R2KZR3_9FIRM|nr:M15 family metallopeptidase [Marinisporobacter balticus]TCO79433.1 D-alanyl-D-alanine carboxypeptidase-like protein [Marinisporobacter balticus]